MRGLRDFTEALPEILLWGWAAIVVGAT